MKTLSSRWIIRLFSRRHDETPDGRSHDPMASAACRRAGVTVETGTRVESVAPDHVRLARGIEWPSTLTVWLAGAAPPAMLASSRLPRSQEGYLAVDNALRAIDGSPVWGAGDCISQRDHEWVPKAGVYAVRQGPVLAHNLSRVPPGAWALADLSAAVGFFVSPVDERRPGAPGIPGHRHRSRWAQALKRFIDQSFMNRYRLPPAD